MLGVIFFQLYQIGPKLLTLYPIQGYLAHENHSSPVDHVKSLGML